ncbi:MAG: hypothetical protein RR811_07460 [Comamonas sp.]
MGINIIGSTIRDEVLAADYLVAEINYYEALEKIHPLIQSLGIQRNLQDASFYSRLRSDLKIGCVIPPITIAFIDSKNKINRDNINDHISNGFVLDGIQRLNALRRVANDLNGNEEKENFFSRILHLNIIIAPSMDRLLYRMITLNNGQKPMSPRHQIDILSETMIDFENLSLKNQNHKSRQVKKEKFAVHRSDIVKGYVAYLSNTTAIDNKLIIEEKMDELIASKIIESDIHSEKFEFIDVLNWIAEKCEDNEEINKWFIVSNNFIGFCAACRSDFETIKSLTSDTLVESILKFEDIFSGFDKRKIRVGDFRRKIVCEYYRNINKYTDMHISDITIELSQA